MSEQTPYRCVLAGLAAMTAVLFLLSLTVGPAAITFGDSLAALFSTDGEAVALIMREIRLPRALLALTIGATLGLSGAALQGFLRNPLAEPGLLGISASASLGAVIAIYTGLAASVPLGLPIAALAAASLAVLALQAIAGSASRRLSVILAGVALSA